jgi:FkbM family methyltransferase
MVKRTSEFFLKQFLNRYPATGFSKLYTTFCFYTRNFLIKIFKDPVIELELGGKRVKMNLSYNLPIMLIDRPYYNSALPRLSRFIREKQGHLTFIDIGANIGDTAILIDEKVPDGNYLCVEASDFYFKILEENAKLLKGITPVKVLCDENESKVNVALDVIGDSAVVAKTAGAEMISTTIDNLVKKYPSFNKTNILKVDTDGYDYKVIRGAKLLIESSKPAMFFEFSPNHLIEAGENPVSIFKFLEEKGYTNMLFYDRFGYIYMNLKTNETDFIERLIEYTKRKKGEYYDILTFHSSNNGDFEKFYGSEMNFFSSKTAQN